MKDDNVKRIKAYAVIEEGEIYSSLFSQEYMIFELRTDAESWARLHVKDSEILPVEITFTPTKK